MIKVANSVAAVATRVFAIVESPFQLLNIKEYLFQNGVEGNSCKVYLVNVINETNLEQLFRVADYLELKAEVLFSHTFFDKNYFSKLSMAWRLFWRLGEVTPKPEAVLLVGDIGSFVTRIFIRAFHPKDLLIVDDGNAVLAQHEKFLAGELFLERMWLERLLMLCPRYRRPWYASQQLKFFTKYYFHPKGEHPAFLRNESLFLRNKLQASKKVPAIFFVGQNVSELGIVSEQSYLHALSEISKRYAYREVYYFPHRRESKEKLDKVVAVTGWGLYVQHFPFEMELMQLGLPDVLATFYSSVVSNVCELDLGLTIDVYQIAERDLLRNQKLIQGVYDHYTTLGVRLFKLSESLGV